MRRNSTELVGRTLLGRYRVESTLGSGGSATTYRALDLARDELVALKILRDDDPVSQRALERELEVLTRVSHPGLLPVRGWGRLSTSEGGARLFYASRLLHGPTLAGLDASGWEGLEPILVDVLAALDFLHRLDIRHGDVSLDNVMIDRDRGVLIDLGCAGPLRSTAPNSPSGTRSTIAPELLIPGASVDGRADLYSFGRVLTLLGERIGEPPPRWSTSLARLCSPKPSGRPADAAEVLEHLGAADRARAFSPPEASELLGRDGELTKIDAVIESVRADEEGPRAIVIDGPPGSGRTRLFTETIRRAGQHALLYVAEASSRAPFSAWFEQSGQSLDEMIDALERLREQGVARVLALDDADRLQPADRRRLRGLLGAVRRDDPFVFVVVGDVPVPEAIALELPLGALAPSAVERWARGRIDDKDLPELMRRSGGHPADVRHWLSELGRGGSWASANPPSHDPKPSSVVGSDPMREAIAVIAMVDEPLDMHDLQAIGVGRVGLEEALARGLLRTERGGLKLTRRFDSGLSSTRCQALWVSVSRWHETHGRWPEAIAAGARGGRDDLEALLDMHSRLPSPHWLEAAAALVERAEPSLRLWGSELYERAGAPDRALVVLDALMDEPNADIRLRRGGCLLRLERTAEALTCLDPLLNAVSGPRHARACDLYARALIKRGDYARAAALAQTALAEVESRSIRASLLEALGVALSYQGSREARAFLDEAAQLLSEIEGGPRDRVRVLSYLAIDAYRCGRLDAAERDYERALAIAHANRLDDQIAHTALNLGTVHHQRGHYGPAFKSYHRAHRLASALDQRATLATLELNLAQLMAAIGAFERARAGVQRARRLADEGRLDLLSAECAALLAEVSLQEGAPDERALLEAGDIFERLGAERELAERDLIEAMFALERGDLEHAQTCVERRRDDASDDLTVRQTLMLARIDLRRGRAARARDVLLSVIDDASRMGLDAIVAEAHGSLQQAWVALGAHTLSEKHARDAREGWERIGAELNPQLRDAFWSHPLRSSLSTPAASETAPSGRVAQLERLLAINRKLSSSLGVDAVLKLAMDSAVELTGAERGFLILRRADGQLSVPVARNLDRERVGRSHLKFSHSIAERAMELEQPVVTVDAESDARFSDHASVHAMKLRSVVAVPIPSPDGVLGALYLDNRFQRARFAELHTDLLLALADQVSIALANARLHEQLARRTEELERERERVEAWSRGQALEIERLNAALATAREDVDERRYDYGALVPRSASMRPVIAVLEKVIDSPLAVLVQGESGTGKELVARAVHFNGPRRGGPFITVNCAALPDTLLESELFGHVRGAFTGAERTRDGLMVAAQGGTLFLDEIGETSLAMQAKLLRALETREIRPLGGSAVLNVDFRLVCATNRDLREEALAGRFREDLYYRVGVIDIRLPPLRERQEDLPELCVRLVARAAKELDRPAPSLSSEAVEVLRAQPWPGNVRQLQNAIRVAMVMDASDVLEPRHFALTLAPLEARRPAGRTERETRERARIVAALEAADWKVAAAAEHAGISRATFYRKIAKYNLR